jgi:hypothetical protein
MKHLLLTLTLIFSTFSLIQAQEIIVPQTNRPLITKRTASWCTNCGTWGWSLFEDLLSDNQSVALVIAAHHSGLYQNEISQEITSNFGAFGQPAFYFNSENQGANSGNGSSIRTAFQEAVQNFNAAMPTVQAGIDARVDDTYTVFVDVKTEFFQEAEGDFYLGVYLIEKFFTGTQTPLGNSALHKQLLRLSANNTTFGELFASGQVSSGSSHEASFTITADMMEQAGITDLERLYDNAFEIATIIWEENDGDYEVVNTNRSFIDILSSNRDIDAVNTFKAYPNPASEQAFLALELTQTLEEATIVLMNAQGQLLRTIHQGELAEGPHQIALTAAALPAGLYIVNMASEQGSISQTLIFH